MNAAMLSASPVSSSALCVQGRVIAALILREVHTLYGNSRLGYLWVIIQTIFGVLVFWGVRRLFGLSAPHGMSMLIFLLSGFIPWHIFNQTVTRCLSAVSANKSLLTFSQVTELDLMIARFVVVWGTQIFCALIIIALAAPAGLASPLREPSSLAATIIYAPLLGLGMGLTGASLARILPLLEKLIPMGMRIIFFCSGVFFSVYRFPRGVREMLLFNPMLQIIEWQRQGFSASAAEIPYNVNYISVWCIALLCIGFLLERHVRGKVIK